MSYNSMELSELVLRDGFLYELIRYPESGERKEIPVKAVPVGRPGIIKIPFNKPYKISDLINKLEKDEDADSYLLGYAGENYSDGYPVSVQFYSKF